MTFACPSPTICTVKNVDGIKYSCREFTESCRLMRGAKEMLDEYLPELHTESVSAVVGYAD